MDPSFALLAYRFEQGESRASLVASSPSHLRAAVDAMLYKLECERLICHERFLP